MVRMAPLCREVARETSLDTFNVDRIILEVDERVMYMFHETRKSEPIKNKNIGSTSIVVRQCCEKVSGSMVGGGSRFPPLVNNNARASSKGQLSDETSKTFFDEM